MNFKISAAFLPVLIATVGLICVSVVLLTLIVDPYGLRPIDTGIRGFNVTKLEDPWRDGRAMRASLLLQQPKTLILGSSRVVLGFDETALRGTDVWPVYNASTYNSDLAHRLAFLKYAIGVDPALEEVWFELSPIDVVNAPGFWQLPPFQVGPLEALEDLAPLVFSPKSIAHSVEVVATNLRQAGEQAPNRNARLHTNGTHTTGLRTLLYSAMNAYRMYPPDAGPDPTWKQALSEIFIACADADIVCRPMLTPLSPQVLHGYVESGMWPQIEEMIVRSASQEDVFNFLWINEFTAEPGNPERSHWIDAIHFASSLGDEMIRDIDAHLGGGKEAFEMMTILTKQSAQSQAAKLYADINRWATNNMDLSWSFAVMQNNRIKSQLSAVSGYTFDQKEIKIAEDHWVVSGGDGSGGDVVGHALHGNRMVGDLTGFAVSRGSGMVAEDVVVVFGSRVVASQNPWFNMGHDVRLDGVEANSGFHLQYRLPRKAEPGDLLNIYGLFPDGTARPIGRSDGTIL